MAGRAVKNSLEIIIKQVRLEGGFESSCTLTSRTLCSKPRNASIRPTVQNIVWKTAEHYMSTVLHTGEKPVERCQSTSCPAYCGTGCLHIVEQAVERCQSTSCPAYCGAICLHIMEQAVERGQFTSCPAYCGASCLHIVEQHIVEQAVERCQSTSCPAHCGAKCRTVNLLLHTVVQAVECCQSTS